MSTLFAFILNNAYCFADLSTGAKLQQRGDRTYTEVVPDYDLSSNLFIQWSGSSHYGLNDDTQWILHINELLYSESQVLPYLPETNTTESAKVASIELFRIDRFETLGIHGSTSSYASIGNIKQDVSLQTNNALSALGAGDQISWEVNTQEIGIHWQTVKNHDSPIDQFSVTWQSIQRPILAALYDNAGSLLPYQLFESDLKLWKLGFTNRNQPKSSGWFHNLSVELLYGQAEFANKATQLQNRAGNDDDIVGLAGSLKAGYQQNITGHLRVSYTINLSGAFISQLSPQPTEINMPFIVPNRGELQLSLDWRF